MHFIKIIKSIFVLLILCNNSFARIVEEIIEVPVSVINNNFINSPKFEQKITVTIFRDDTKKSSPYILVNHGRSGNDRAREMYGRVNDKMLSEYAVKSGFVVIIPTRMGYGISGGPDAEYTGVCGSRNYKNGVQAVIDQSKQVLSYVFNLGYVDKKGIVLGQSFGGLASIALSTQDIPGIVAAVNFAGGGDAGRPHTHPGNPCDAYLIENYFESLGAQSKIPSLWLYSVNDKLWGEKLPKDWFTAFQKAGGKGRFVNLPAYKDNGHSIFTGNPESWKNHVEKFLKEIGF
jgi:dienelactone hydrolase